MCMNERLITKDSNAFPKIISPEIKNLSGHLDLSIEGSRPIVACVGTMDNFKKSEISIKLPKGHISNNFLLRNWKTKLKNVDWAHGTYESEENDYLTGGISTYIISAIDDSNKYSQKFGACTGLIVAGIDKETRENISFITHQPSCSVNFIADLKKRLLEMKEKCMLGTIDAVVVGGIGGRLFEKGYIKTIRLLSVEVRQTLGFEPVVINGPKTMTPITVDEIYYDNNRKLYLIRPEVNQNTGSFVASDIEKYKDKFE